jgi:hypothetical protein
MNLHLLLPLAFPFACLALLSLTAFLGVVVLGGAFYAVGAIKVWLGEVQIAVMTRGAGWLAMLIRSITLKDRVLAPFRCERTVVLI